MIVRHVSQGSSLSLSLFFRPLHRIMDRSSAAEAYRYKEELWPVQARVYIPKLAGVCIRAEGASSLYLYENCRVIFVGGDR